MMKKFYQYIITSIIFGMGFNSCQTEELNENNLQGKGTFTIEIVSNALQSRSTTPGDTELNENKFTTIDLFLFNDQDGVPTGNAKYHERFNIENNTGNTSIKPKITEAMKGELFSETDNQCIAYVIVNLPPKSVGLPKKLAGGLDPEALKNEELSIEDLKGETITAEFNTDEAQQSFVMDGYATITKNSTETSEKIEGNISVDRAASKISLTIDQISSTITDEAGNEWVFDKEDTDAIIHVWLYNGVNKSNIDVTKVNYVAEQSDYFDSSSPISITYDDTESKYIQKMPFYSYSQTWESEDDNEPYLLVKVPWKQTKKNGNEVEGASYLPYYYQIPLTTRDDNNNIIRSLKRNTYYQISLTVGILGSPSLQESVKIENCSYTIFDWSTLNLTAELKGFRYLIVDKNFVEMNNVNDLYVGFSTSHEVEIVNAVLKKPVLNPLNSADATISSYTLNTTKVDEQDYIYFMHELDNEWSDTDKSYDYVPYTLELDIRHKDNPNFIEHVKIVQYPAMYVDYNKNGGTGNSNPKTDKDYGYVWVNKGRNQYGNVHGLTASNKNPNMYIITTTALPQNSKYVIGDPRNTSINNNLGNQNSDWSASAPTLPASNERRLSFYYPTDNTNRTKNMIAPKFRVASSYGVTSVSKYNDMLKRCASYQEYGYPAGRWRMPTHAELDYIVKLSAEGKIPKLFNDDGDSPIGNYFCAHGVAYPKEEGYVNTLPLDNNEHGVRCVYDEWYWTDKCDISTFTWGDKEITW